MADPIRLRVLRHLATRGSASIAELAHAAGVHANTVRAHVAALERADVLRRESSVPRGRGRPALRFRLHDDTPPPDADPHGLAEVLASAAGTPGLAAGLARLGFQARVAGERVQLSACPCPLVAPTHPETICQLAHGAVNGILAGSGRQVRTAEHDPDRRRCTLRLG